MPFLSRQTKNLRKGRLSIPDAQYFVTWCTANRAQLLEENFVCATVRQAIANLELSGNGRLLAASIMPDHIHLLLELGTPLSISQVVGKLKSAVVRAHHEIKWQENFFEHQLRTEDLVENFAFYIFMNPYCANVCSCEKTWPGWIGLSTICWEFEAKLRPGGLPPSEWVQIADRFAQTLPPAAV